VFCDVNMPQVDGLTMVENLQDRIKAGRVQSVPVVMLTTESSMAQVLRAKAAGIVGWIIKPPTAAVIREMVARFLPSSPEQ